MSRPIDGPNLKPMKTGIVAFFLLWHVVDRLNILYTCIVIMPIYVSVDPMCLAHASPRPVVVGSIQDRARLLQLMGVQAECWRQRGPAYV